MTHFFRDTKTIFKTELLITARNPFWLFFGLFQPVVYLLLFAPFLQGVASAPGFPAQNVIQFFVPGLLILNALFNASWSGFGLLNKLQEGVIERIRVTPVSRVALAFGCVLDTVTTLLLQSIIILCAALCLGFRPNIIGVILLMGLLLLIGIALASSSHALALMVKEDSAMVGVTNFFTLPLMLLSGVMLPVTFAPPFIQILAKCDPFSYAVDAARALTDGVLMHASVWQAFGIFGALAILALYWLVRQMREAVA